MTDNYETTMSYSDIDTLWKVCAPILLLLGTAGNALAILLLYRCQVPSSFHVFLMAQAACDLLSLYFGMMPKWIKALTGFELEGTHIAVCRLTKWLSFTLGMLSAWLLAALTMQRAVQDLSPVPSRSAMMRRQTLASIAALILLIAAYQCYQFGARVVVKGKCEYSDDFLITFMPVIGWINAILYSVLPLAFIIVADVLLVTAVSRNIRVSRSVVHHSMSGSRGHLLNAMPSVSMAKKLSLTKSVVLTKRPSGTVVVRSRSLRDRTTSVPDERPVNTPPSAIATFTASRRAVRRGTTTPPSDDVETSATPPKAYARHPSLVITKSAAHNPRNVAPEVSADQGASGERSRDDHGVTEAGQTASTTSAPAAMGSHRTSTASPAGMLIAPRVASAPPIVKRVNVIARSSAENLGSVRQSVRIHQGRSHTTFSLISVTLLFVLLTSMYSYYSVKSSYNPRILKDDNVKFMVNLAAVGNYANQAVKMFFFFLTGTVFKDELRHFFGAHQNTRIDNQSSDFETESV